MAGTLGTSQLDRTKPGVAPSPPLLGYGRGATRHVSYWIHGLSLLGMLVALILLLGGALVLVSGLAVLLLVALEGRFDTEWLLGLLLVVGAGGGMLLAAAVLGYAILRVGPPSEPSDGDHERSAE